MPQEHYFSSKPADDDALRTVTVRLAGRELELLTAGGVFSPAHVDLGTRVLLDHVPDPPTTGHLLDLGTGWGPMALELALESPEATVWAVDVNERALDLVRRNAARLGLVNLKFQEGDACQLTGVPDKAFDLTLSVFGAMFAPRPHDVAKEMVRVTKPGGRIVMGNWIPNDPTSFVSQVLKISSAFTPPPPEGFISPILWGVEQHILERFAAAGVPKEQVTMTRDTFFFGLPSVSPEQLIGLFRDFYGPTMNAFEAAGKNGKTEELQRLLVNEAKAHNKAATGTHIPATFMRVTVQL